jgi:hypothetical protein
MGFKNYYYYFVCKSISKESVEGRNPNIQEVYKRDSQLGRKRRMQVQKFDKTKKMRTIVRRHPSIKRFDISAFNSNTISHNLQNSSGFALFNAPHLI